MDINEVLLQGTLKFMFTLITYGTDESGKECYSSIKVRKKPFVESFRTHNEKIVVKLVDKYPEVLEENIMYVKRNGKTVWYKKK